MGTLWQDIRFALRQLRRNPVFTLAATLTLALGIAATTTVFSFVDAVLLRPLPYPDASRLFVLWNARQDNVRETLSYPNFLDYRSRATEFDGLALFRRRRFNVSGESATERVRGAVVTADFFRTLGVTLVQGRDFARGEDRPGQDQVVLVSERFWRRQLTDGAGQIGRTVRVEGAVVPASSRVIVSACTLARRASSACDRNCSTLSCRRLSANAIALHHATPCS